MVSNKPKCRDMREYQFSDLYLWQNFLRGSQTAAQDYGKEHRCVHPLHQPKY